MNIIKRIIIMIILYLFLACVEVGSFYHVHQNMSSSNCMLLCSDGDILLGGYNTVSSGYETQGIILRLNHSGCEKESWILPGISDVTSLLEGPDCSYIALGNVTEGLYESHMVLVALDSQGNTLWRSDYCEMPSSTGLNIIPSADGGYLALGTAGRFESRIGLIVKYHQNGDVLWSQTYRSQTSSFLNDAIQVDDRFLVVGGSMDDSNLIAPWLLLVDENGQVLLNSLLDSESEASAASILETEDGFDVLLSLFSGTRIDPVVLMLDRNYQNIGSVNLGAASLLEFPTGLTATDEGNVIAVCSRFDANQTRSGILAIELSSTGSVLRQREIIPVSGHLVPFGFVKMPDGSLLICGQVGPGVDISSDHAFILRTDSNWNIVLPSN